MHFRGHVCRGFVQDDAELLVLEQRCRVFPEEDDLLLPISWIALPDRRAVEDVECGKQGGRAVPNAILGARLGSAGLHRQRNPRLVQRPDL